MKRLWRRCRGPFLLALLSLAFGVCMTFVVISVVNGQDKIQKRAVTAQSDAKTSKHVAKSTQADVNDIIRVLKKKHILLKGASGKGGLRGGPGPQGVRGRTGATGPAGPGGKDGSTGPAGPAGADGSTVSRADLQAVLTAYCAAHECRGPQGDKGDTGPAGPQGPAGLNGANGENALPQQFTLNYAPSFSATCTDDGTGTHSYTCTSPPAP